MNLFINGYNKIRGKAIKPSRIHIEFKFNNIDNPIDRNIISKIIASLLSNFSDANGRDFVLSIFLSIFLSIISFIMQPADLIIKEPYANNKSK